MRIKTGYLFLILLFIGIKGLTQICPNPGQNPASAFPVCGVSTFSQTSVPICAGSAIPGPCGAGLFDKNPYWYSFTCFTGGTLGFQIKPINLADDYDWQVFDITGRNPNDVYTDPTLFVACSWSGAGGITGASSAGTSLIACAGGTPLFTSMPTLIVGHNYLLMVSHWTNSQIGYSLTFTGGTAVITDPLLPDVKSASASCDGTQVVVHFNKKMRCNSIAGNGSDFTIAGATVISAAGYGCTTGFDTDSVLLLLSASLAPGNYNVAVAIGADGNTVMDNCGTEVTAGANVPFTINTQPSLAMGTIAPPACAPVTLTLTFAEPILCSSVAANGSDFVITGPSAVTVNAATAVNCVGILTNSITLQLNAAVITPGTYQVALAIGTDGNTLLGQCNRNVPVNANASFTIAPQPPLLMAGVTIASCVPSTLNLIFPQPINCNSVAANGSDFVITGPASVTITSATATNCDANGQTTTVSVQLSVPMAVSGTYQMAAANGSDGNTITGSCARQITVGTFTQFNIPPQTPVNMATVTPPPCIPTSITLTFPELVNCNSVAANGSDFTITGPSAVTIISATAVNCNASGETTTITLQFSAPILTTGAYQVVAAIGSDGNTITAGVCNRQVVAGNTAPFTLAAQPALPMATVTPPPCIPPSVTLVFPEPIKCNSIAANGSDFIVTGPSAVTVVGATPVNCDANGETTTVTVRFFTNVLGIGNYQVQAVQGSDGNTIIGACNRAVTVGNTASFSLAPQPPVPIGTVTNTSCAPTSVVIDFTETLDCTSLTPTGSEFTITGPSGVVIASAGGQCNINPSNPKLVINFAAPIAVGGTYRIQVGNGTDGNTIRGDCNRYIAVGDFVTFTVPVVPPVVMDSIVPIACAPSSLKLILDAPIRCSSIAADGSDFIVSGAAPVTVASAAGVCDANGLTTQINIQLSAPIVIGGNYTVQLTPGSDGNTFLSECYRPAPVAQLSFIASDTVSAVFQHQIQFDCQTDLINFSHDGQHNVNQWTWTVNGAGASSSQTFSQSFSASSTNQVQLTVSNGLCSDTYNETIILNNKVTAGFSGPDMACPDDSVGFRNLSTGEIDTWQWTFGNGQTSSLQNPPAQVYPTTGIETLYPVSLTVENSMGCQTSMTKSIKVFASCIIAVPTAFTPDGDGLNDYLYPLNAIKAEKLDFKVFNRWGQLVFHSKDWTQKWDGKINGLPQGTNVYVWTLSYVHRDTKVKYELKGTSTLIR